MEAEWGPAEKELGLDRDGKLVDGGSREAVSLLVAKGGMLPMAIAVKHGLTAHAAPSPAASGEETEESTAPKPRPLDLRRTGGKARTVAKKK